MTSVNEINTALHGTAMQLQDAQALAKQHDTFWAPSNKQLKQVKNGSIVKICNGKERFWVIIEGRQKNIYMGHIRNNLLFSTYAFGDLIAFEENQIVIIKILLCNMFSVVSENL